MSDKKLEDIKLRAEDIQRKWGILDAQADRGWLIQEVGRLKNKISLVMQALDECDDYGATEVMIREILND